MFGTENIRALPAQTVFVPRISHDSLGARLIPLLLAGQAYDSGVFQVRGHNKLEIHARSNIPAKIYVYMGPDPAALKLFVHLDGNEKAWFQLGTNPEVGTWVDQFSIQISADFARVVYVNDTIGPQTWWEYQIQAKPIAEPHGIRMYQDELLPYFPLSQHGYLTLTQDYRLRVNAIIGGAGGVVDVQGQPRTCWELADNSNYAPGGTTASAQVDVGCGVGGLAIKKIGIYCAVTGIPNGSSGGNLHIEYRPRKGVGAWRTYEVIPLEAIQRINKLLKPTAPEYNIYFQAGAGGAFGVDLHVTALPQT